MKASSIRLKFFFAISAIALVFIGVLLALNVFFYDDYYMITRRTELRSAYQNVQHSYNGNVADLVSVLDTLENRNVIRLAVTGMNGEVLYSSSFSSEPAQNETNQDQFSSAFPFYGSALPGFGLDDQRFRSIAILTSVLHNMDVDTIRSNGYQFLTVSLNNDEQYLCLAGALDLSQGECLIAYMPYAYIENNSTFNLLFLLIAGGCSLMICVVLGYLISRQFTRPLIAMAGVADRMSELDFSTKYEGDEKDEIGQLGQSLNRLSAYLEQSIGELQQSNEQLAEQIREKERIDNMRQEFIINVSHELKTPIALIQGYAEGLTAGVADDPEDRKFYCDTIADEATHMNRLVMQLLNLSRLELGGEQVYAEDVDLHQLCMGAVDKTRVLCENKQLSVDYDQTHMTVHTDGDLLLQVLMNYLSNAIRYTASGGHIRISVAERDAGVELVVFNQGDGLPEDELPRIWEKFYRTDRARTREAGGTGIGLALVHAIADTLHGSCGARNVTDGIEFWFWLPQTSSDR